MNIKFESGPKWTVKWVKVNGLESNWTVIWAKGDGQGRYWTVRLKADGPQMSKWTVLKFSRVTVDGL